MKYLLSFSAAFLLVAATDFASEPTSTEAILDYTSTTLLSNIVACIHDAKNDPMRKEFYAKQYYSLLYILWSSTHGKAPIPHSSLISYFRAFEKNSKRLKFESLIAKDDPLSIKALTPAQIKSARGSILASPYWDWVIDQNSDPKFYQVAVARFRKQLSDASNTAEQGAAVNP